MSHTIILLRVIFFICILALIDLYVFKGVKAALSIFEISKRHFIYWTFWLLNLFIFVGILYVFLNFKGIRGPDSKLFAILGGVLILSLVPKLVFSIFLLSEDFFRILRAISLFIKNLFVGDGGTETLYFDSRRQFFSQVAMLMAGIPFLAILYGIIKGKYDFRVHKVTLSFEDLPDNFHGLTITQISDIHSGSFDNFQAVKRGVDLANAQKSDLILFTGDLVNNHAQEMEPWIELFKTLNAPMGKYSIVGNHDYGDYAQWPSPEAKQENFNKLIKTHEEIGFKLLLNENVTIKKDKQEISLLGVENWGLGFLQKGDLEKAMNGVAPEAFKILMSHDPSHWDAKILAHKDMVHLTLAGHTHGMQFGIEIPGIKWSPAQYRYPRWAGLYEDSKKYLYVNRGFGFLGFPGRVGIWPEITVIKLLKEKRQA